MDRVSHLRSPPWRHTTTTIATPIPNPSHPSTTSTTAACPQDNLQVPPRQTACAPTAAPLLPPDSTSCANSSGRYRLNAQNLFLTYPQCPIPRQQALAQLQALHQLQWAIVAQEHHQDGNLHLHVACRLSKKPNIKRPDHFDLMQDNVRYHGNYQAIRKLSAVLDYCRKSDQDPLVHGELPTIKTRSGNLERTKSCDLVAGLINSGAGLDEINREYPGFTMMNLSRIQLYQSWMTQRARSTPTKVCLSVVTTALANGPTRQIASWLNKNLCQPRRLRDPQLYISGPPLTHKTRLLEYLRDHFSVYTVPRGEEYDNLWSDDHQLAVLDEFDSSYRQVSWLLSFLDGSEMTLRTKGGQVLKTKNVPVIICSNFTSSEVVPENRYQAFITRIQPVYVGPEEIVQVENIIFNYQGVQAVPTRTVRAARRVGR